MQKNWVDDNLFPSVRTILPERGSGRHDDDYHLPVTARRMIKSAKPPIANNDAASSKNSLEVGERFGAFRLTSLRIISNIAATANRIGQRGLSWLTISCFRKMCSLIGPPL